MRLAMGCAVFIRGGARSRWRAAFLGFSRSAFKCRTIHPRNRTGRRARRVVFPDRRCTLKALIPAAGMGTRFLPATKAQPKEMLLVVDRPVIQYVVEEGLGIGCR